jgi:hypothetical protein
MPDIELKKRKQEHAEDWIEAGIENRNKGVTLKNEIMKTHRVEGILVKREKYSFKQVRDL